MPLGEPTTDIDIANRALVRMGQSRISAFGENTGTGLILQSDYECERDSLLRTIPWNFARKRVNLAMLSIAPIPFDMQPNSSGPGSVVMTGAFQLPIDFLRLYRFAPREAHWRIIGNQIYTDAASQINTNQLLGLEPINLDGSDNQPGSIYNMPANNVG